MSDCNVNTIAFKEDARLVADHPDVERIMQKEVTQHGAQHRPLRDPFSGRRRLPSGNCTGAASQRSMYSSTQGQSVCLRTARINRLRSRLSKHPEMSRCKAQS